MAEKKTTEKLPEFNEEKYVNDTIKGAKISILSFLYGIVVAVLSRLVWGTYASPEGYPPAFILGIFAIVPLIAYLKNKQQMKTMDWFSSGALYFLTWMAFWIIFVNPPFISP